MYPIAKYAKRGRNSILTIQEVHNTIFFQIACLQYIAGWQIVLLRRGKIIAGWTDREMSAPVLIQDAAEDGRRVKVRPWL
jgi:hypothetical protein